MLDGMYGFARRGPGAVAWREMRERPACQTDDLVGDVGGGVGLGELADVAPEGVELVVVGHRVDGQGQEGAAGIGIGDVESGLLLHEGEGVLRLVVFGHVG